MMVGLLICLDSSGFVVTIIANLLCLVQSYLASSVTSALCPGLHNLITVCSMLLCKCFGKGQNALFTCYLTAVYVFRGYFCDLRVVFFPPGKCLSEAIFKCNICRD